MISDPSFHFGNSIPVLCILPIRQIQIGTCSGGFLSQKGNLYKPEGDGTFPAVVVLHGCAGVDYHHRAWAEHLAERENNVTYRPVGKIQG